MKDAGELASDAIMRGLERRLGEIFAGALNGALQDNAAFLRKIADVDAGKIKPNPFYNTPAKVKRWRAGFTREALRQDGVAEKIRQRLAAAGSAARPEILKARTGVYIANRTFTAKAISSKAGGKVAFNQYDRRQIDILLSERETPFTKLAYRNLGSSPTVVQRLTSELAQATIKGESQREIIKRIRAVTGQSQYQAQRVAQTERVRVQSQARNDAGNEAAAMGLKITKEWSARMVNTRDTHADLNGTKIPQGEAFQTSAGNTLMYPGDPSAPAAEVIQCHCVLITDVEV